MKKILTLAFALLASHALTQAEDFDLGEHGKLSVTVPKTWSAAGRDIKGMGYNLDFKPNDTNSTLCKVTLIYVPSRDKLDKTKTEADFKQAAGQMAPMSVEKKIVAKEYKLKAGHGFYATFTDPSLVGKPPVKGDWKATSPGLADISPDIRLSITIFSDAPADAFHQQAVEIIESITVKKK